MQYVIPAAEAAEELAVDNKVLAGFIGCLPAMMRNATGSSGGAVVGDPAAYDEELRAKLAKMMEQPSTQVMLTVGCTARYAWAAMRKGGEGESTKEDPTAKARQLNAQQITQARKCLGPIIARVRAATPKGAKPNDPGTISALKEELNQLEADAQVLKDPTELYIQEIQGCLTAVLNLCAAATFSLRMKDQETARAAAEEAGEPTPDDAALETAAEQERWLRARNSRSVKKLKESVSEALSMSLDVYMVYDELDDAPTPTPPLLSLSSSFSSSCLTLAATLTLRSRRSMPPRSSL